ncbi:MAG: peptidoglycan DD-metalloendopeptidase family protein, partial [Actinobacteria bacterium]|nr:peptidoglycan DD-metalloendopeptidase family protein [Actinomycetota bacterium]
MASLSASSGTRFVAALVVVALAAFCLPPAAAATEHPWLIPPVDAPIKRGFDLPEGQKGPGNRGLDYAVTEGTSARAAGDGRVTFAGHVAGTLAITIDHGDFLETTYTGMDELYVRPGDDVDQGHWLGTTGAELHFGVKLRDIYVDPQDYLGPIDMGDAIHLIPIEDKGSWGDMVEQMMDVDFEGLDTIGCTERDLLRTPSHRRAPSDNIAVMIGGINDTWSEGSKRSVAGTADDLGYEPESSYVVSYSLDQGGYSRIDTFSDLRSSAQKLDALLQRIALEHPGSDVDILAHSQGGLVARYLLETAATSWNVRRPRVDHLVTFGTPHQGAPLGDVSEELGG